ncbi:MAG: hypothetical protein M3295_04145, partial [Chloroflexota bacterium]|nr:hypothetical protein [Chloroflexota bacterium]
VTLAPMDAGGDVARAAVNALGGLIGPHRPLRELSVERVDRAPVGESALAPALREAGFRPTYRSYLLRA